MVSSFSELRRNISYINAAIFMICSLTYHNSWHINIEKETTRSTMDLQET